MLKKILFILNEFKINIFNNFAVITERETTFFLIYMKTKTTICNINIKLIQLC